MVDCKLLQSTMKGNAGGHGDTAKVFNCVFARDSRICIKKLTRYQISFTIENQKSQIAQYPQRDSNSCTELEKLVS